MPVFDVFADVRDCLLAWNKGAVTNVADCLGAVVSAAGSAGTIVGAATSITGFGAIVGGGVLVAAGAVDSLEDVQDVTKIIRAYLKTNTKKASAVFRIVNSKLGSTAEKVVNSGRLIPTSAGDAVSAKRAFELKNADNFDFDYQTAYAISKQAPGDVSITKYADVAKDIDNFDGISAAALKVDAVKAANDYPNLKQLDGQTLSTVASVGKSDEAATLIGRTGDAGRKMLDDLQNAENAVAVERFLSLGEKLEDANGLNKIGRTAEELAAESRAAMVYSRQQDFMELSTVNRLTKSIDEMATGDVDNFAKHLDNKIAENTKNLNPATSENPRSAFNPVQGATNEMVLGREVFGTRNVEAIGVDIGPMAPEADLVLSNGQVVEAKAKGSLSSQKDLIREVDNLNEFARMSDEYGDPNQPAIFVANDPDNIYRSGQIGETKLPKIQGAEDELENQMNIPVNFASASDLTDDLSQTDALIPKFTN